MEAVLDGKNMELFDIRTEAGELTGEVRERSIAHENGDRHGTSHVWIVRQGEAGKIEVLMQKRSQNKDSFPGCYDISSAGHLPSGCDYLESALRELEEELGIKAEPEELAYAFMHLGYMDGVFYGKAFHNAEISAVYVYQKEIEIAELKLQKEEVESVCWMEYETALEEIREEASRGVCEKYCIFPDEFEQLGEWLEKQA